MQGSITVAAFLIIAGLCSTAGAQGEAEGLMGGAQRSERIDAPSEGTRGGHGVPPGAPGGSILGRARAISASDVVAGRSGARGGVSRAEGGSSAGTSVDAPSLPGRDPGASARDVTLGEILFGLVLGHLFARGGLLGSDLVL